MGEYLVGGEGVPFRWRSARVGTDQKQSLNAAVRPFRPRDRKRLVEITRQAFEGRCIEAAVEAHFGVIENLSWDERKVRGLRYELTSPFVETRVAELDGRVVGYITYEVIHNASTGWVRNLAVDPAFQGRGVGTRLLQAVLSEFRAMGLKLSRIETLASNQAAREFYSKKGFREVIERVFFYREL